MKLEGAGELQCPGLCPLQRTSQASQLFLATRDVVAMKFQPCLHTLDSLRCAGYLAFGAAVLAVQPRD